MSEKHNGSGPRAPGAPAASPTQSSAVEGERGTSIAAGMRSLQARISSTLAAGLMIALGMGALTWYYTTALSRQAHARQQAKAESQGRAQGEMPLPPLGTFEPPHTTVESSQHPPAGTVAGSQSMGSLATGSQSTGVLAPGAQSMAAPATLADLPLSAAPIPLGVNGAGSGSLGESLRPYGYGAPSRKSKRERALERRLTGPVFARESQASTPGLETDRVAPGAAGASQPPGASQALEVPQPLQATQASGELSAPAGMAPLLQPMTTTAVRARILPTQRLLLPKGGFIDCTLETAIDSTLPGMTTCVTATDTFSADGTVVLLERGTKLVGETHGQVQQGAARVFVLWTEARTPGGVIVPLDSPGTDELGRSGLPGSVNRHFWERFGAALLISVVDGAVQSAVQSSSHGGGPLIYNPSASESVMTEALKGTVSIPPTVVKRNGDRIQILVARDLDFRSVYELRTHASAR